MITAGLMKLYFIKLLYSFIGLFLLRIFCGSYYKHLRRKNNIENTSEYRRGKVIRLIWIAVAFYMGVIGLLRCMLDAPRVISGRALGTEGILTNYDTHFTTLTIDKKIYFGFPHGISKDTSVTIEYLPYTRCAEIKENHIEEIMTTGENGCFR